MEQEALKPPEGCTGRAPVADDAPGVAGATQLYEQAGMRVTREIDAYERVVR